MADAVTNQESDLPANYQSMWGQYFANPQTLGPDLPIIRVRPEDEQPLTQGNAISTAGHAILQGILSPYHAFIRAWENESAGERAHPGDAIQATLPFAVGRLPVTAPTPAAVSNVTARELADVPGVYTQVPGVITDFRGAPNPNAANAVDNAIYGQIRRGEGQQIPHDPYQQALLEQDLTRMIARVQRETTTQRREMLQGEVERLQGILRTTDETLLPAAERATVEAQLQRTQAELRRGSLSVIEGEGTGQVATTRRILGEFGIPESNIRLRQSAPDPQTGDISHYMTVTDPAGGPNIRIRIANHPGHVRRGEIDASNMSADELRAAISERLASREGAPDVTKGYSPRHPAMDQPNIQEVISLMRQQGDGAGAIANYLNRNYRFERPVTANTVQAYMTRADREAAARQGYTTNQAGTIYPSLEDLQKQQWIVPTPRVYGRRVNPPEE